MRTGEPSHAELPEWPRYDLTQRMTRVFDADESRAAEDPDREARLFLRPWRLPEFL